MASAAQPTAEKSSPTNKSLRTAPRAIGPQEIKAEHLATVTDLGVAIAADNLTISRLSQATLSREWLEFVEKNKAQPKFFTAANKETYQPFADRVKKEYYRALNTKPPAPSPEERLLALKAAFDRVLEKTKYNEAYTSAFDGIVPAKDGLTRLQCSSGTDLFTALAREILVLPKNYKLVHILTPGHVFPGVINEQMQVTGVETTVVGGKVTFLANNLPANVPMRVVTALHDDVLRLIPAKFLAKYAALGVLASNIKEPPNLDSADPYAFGKKEAPKGDIERAKTDELPLSVYSDMGRNYSNIGRPAGSTGTLPKAEREALVKLADVLNPAELEEVQKLLSHSEKGVACWSLHVPILDDKTLTDQQKIDRPMPIVEDLAGYIEQHDLLKQLDRVQSIFKQHQIKGLTVPTIIDAYDSLANNVNVLDDRVQKGKR